MVENSSAKEIKLNIHEAEKFYPVYARPDKLNESLLYLYGLPQTCVDAKLFLEEFKSKSLVCQSCVFITQHGVRVLKIQFKSKKYIQLFLKENVIEVFKPKTGIIKWIEEYVAKLKPQTELHESIGLSIKSIETEEFNNMEAHDNSDVENGWSVVRKDKRNSFKQKESVVQKLERKLQKDMTKGLPNFYSNQTREFKKTQLKKLKHKFELDKKKIEFIKKSNKLKPFSE